MWEEKQYDQPKRTMCVVLNNLKVSSVFLPTSHTCHVMYILERARISSGFLCEKEKLDLCMSFIFIEMFEGQNSLFTK